MKVGPTERIGLSFAGAVSGTAGAGAGTGSVAGVPAVVAGAAPFFLGEVGAVFDVGCDIFLALSSVTMMSPCCSAAALSSIDFSASDQVWPAALQEHDGTNSLR